MGTIFSIVAYAGESAILDEAVRRSFAEIDRLNAVMSHYDPTSALSAIGRGAGPHGVAPELFAILATALRYSEETGGAFDITVGPLMKSWGFFQHCGRLPSQAELAEALQRIGYRHVLLHGGDHTIDFDQPGIELDLGAIGKGYAVDRVAEILRSAGIERALVSSGSSSIYALGAPPGEEAWKISVSHPFDHRKEALLLRLRNLSISLSGGYENSFVLDGRSYSHLLDPRTGQPVAGTLMSAVIARCCAESDALSTAFFVMGTEAAREYLARHPGLTAIFCQPAGAPPSYETLWFASPGAEPPWDGLLSLQASSG